MKIFGFRSNKKFDKKMESLSEKKFINITCNIILGLIVAVVFSLSVFSPVATTVSLSNSNVIYRGNTSKNNVSLMINVYWGTEYLDDMLLTLKKNDVKTTFFVGGCWVAKNNDMLIKIAGDGHEIANHGYNHKDHAKISKEQNKDEIYMNGEVVESLIGKKMNLFAPPSGSYNDLTVSVAESLGYKTIMWSRDTIDWRDKDENLIFKRATEKTENGDLILMHPTECTAKALDRIIKTLKEKGFCLTTVSNTIEI